jgi:hypothetical protein
LSDLSEILGQEEGQIGKLVADRPVAAAFTLGVIVKYVRALRRADSELRRVRGLDVMIERIAATHIPYRKLATLK